MGLWGVCVCVSAPIYRTVRYPHETVTRDAVWALGETADTDSLWVNSPEFGLAPVLRDGQLHGVAA